MALLSMEGISTGYAGRTLSAGLELEIEAGELVCLLGPNGAGKSTLLRTLTGMQAPMEGTVRIDGEDIHRIGGRRLARLLAVVLTDRVQAGLLSGYELVSLGRYPHTGWGGRLGPEDHAAVRRAIEAVGAEELAGRRFAELSDGERQRLMMARALAQEPRLLVLDEVTAFLDVPRRVELMRLLLRLAREEGVTILLSTHDLELALRSADRVWLLGPGGGLHDGAPEDLALDGTVGRVFGGDGVRFDPETGHFDLHGRPGRRGWVEGTGAARFWAERTLARAGYTIGERGEAELRVRCLAGGGWECEGGLVVNTLGALFAACR